MLPFIVLDMKRKEKHCIDEAFTKHIAEEINKEKQKKIKKDDKLEKDFLERKEENDKYFFS